MSARIAPDPVGNAANDRSRAQGYSVPDGTGEPSHAPGRHAPSPPRIADSLPQLPLPPDPPGTNFAAAVLAGALPPKPQSSAEALRRLGSAWRPPSSQFHLLDRIA